MSDQIFAGEIITPMASRRFYLGKIDKSDGDNVSLSHVFCMDELRKHDTVSYAILPDPILFSAQPSNFKKSSFMNWKTLDLIQDSKMIENYEKHVQTFRAQSSGLVTPDSKVKSIIT